MCQYAHTRCSHVCKQESCNSPQNGVGYGKEDTSDLSEYAKEDEEEATPSARTTVGAACDGNDSVVLREYRERGNGEEGRHETGDAVTENATLNTGVEDVAGDWLAGNFSRSSDVSNRFHSQRH